MFQFLLDRLGAADVAIYALFDLVPGLLGRQEGALVLDDRQGRPRRRVARRGGADALQEILDEVPEMRLEFLAGLPVGLGDVDRNAPAHLLRPGRVAGL